MRQMRHLPPLPLMQIMANLVLRDEAKFSKIEQMWHLQMVCSKFAIEVNGTGEWKFSQTLNCTKIREKGREEGKEERWREEEREKGGGKKEGRSDG